MPVLSGTNAADVLLQVRPGKSIPWAHPEKNTSRDVVAQFFLTLSMRWHEDQVSLVGESLLSLGSIEKRAGPRQAILVV